MLRHARTHSDTGVRSQALLCEAEFFHISPLVAFLSVGIERIQQGQAQALAHARAIGKENDEREFVAARLASSRATNTPKSTPQHSKRRRNPENQAASSETRWQWTTSDSF